MVCKYFPHSFHFLDGIFLFPILHLHPPSSIIIIVVVVVVIITITSSIGSKKVLIRNTDAGLPRWRSGWESACRCGGHGFEPWSGRIPHAAEQLGPCATTTEPALYSP